jgi:hypothetical protein
LKRLIDYKEKTIDQIVLYFYYCRSNDLSKLIRGFCGESEWTMKNDFQYAALDSETVIFPKNVCHPDKIIDVIKCEISTILTKDKSDLKQVAESENCVSPIISSKGDSQKALAINVI